MEIGNCPKCGDLFIPSAFRDLCEKCYREEEDAFERVNQFLKQKENRMASMMQVVEATEVDEELIYKFIRKGRIRLIHFPNLGYPCEVCGKRIQKGILCEDCMSEVKNDLEVFEKEQERQQEIMEKRTYYSTDKKSN